MMHMLSASLYTVGGFVLGLGLLVFVHEFGHYAVARLCGIKVLRFSIGFGPVLWARRAADGTEWALSAVPLGGYVRMVDEREGEVAEHDLPYAFNRQTLWRRAAVVAAGPLTNLLLAVLLFAVVGMLGEPGLRPYVAAPAADSTAARAGLQAGDLVLSVGQRVVADWTALRLALATSAATSGQVDLALRAQDGRQRIVRLPAASLLAADGGDPAAALGLKVWNPPIPPRLGMLITGGAGERQGLRSGDTVLAVDGQPIADWVAFVEKVRAAPGRTLQLTILRAGARLELAITPDAEGRDGRSIGKIGAGVDVALTDPYVVRIQRGPVDALREGVRRTWDLGGMMLSTLGRMLAGGVSTRAIGGPLQIAAAAGDSAQLGLVPFLGFLAVISVSLGVLNLLPIPVLDGGHLLYYSFELISGRPLPDRIIAAGTRVGIVLLFGLMALAFYNDINRFFSG